VKIQISWDNTTEALSAHVVMARSGAPNGKEEAGFLQDMFFKNQHVRVRNPKESFIIESELDTEKQATIKELTAQSMEQDGIKNVNITRVMQHIQGNDSISHDKQQTILAALQQVQQENFAQNDSYYDTSNDISAYEAETSYSQAAAEYNQLVMDIYNTIEVNGEKPQWWEEYPACTLLLETGKWKEADKKWMANLGQDPEQVEKTILLPKILRPDQDRFEALTSPNAIAAYETRNATIVDLIGLEVAKIRALTSVAALQLYQAKQVKAADFINLTAAEINSAIVDKLEQANLSRNLLDHPNEVCFKRGSNF